MSPEDKLKEKFGTETGMTVPEGYFASLEQKIMAELPAYPEAPRAVEMSRWQRVKPYVYLAAMFAGIWLMMTVFHHASGYGSLNLDNPPEQVVTALATADTDYVPMATATADYELEEEMSDCYGDIESFQDDFGYDLKPQYASMTVNV